MSEPAAVVDAPNVELTISLPSALVDELTAYAGRWDADLVWALRRGIRHMLDDEQEQARRLAAGPRRVARGRRAAA
jgi:predicted transcriptional regulator